MITNYKIIFQIILTILGYKIDDSINDALKTQKVIIFPHTSLFEAAIMLLAVNLINDNHKISFLSSAYFYDTPIIGYFLKKFGAIRVKGNKNGLVKEVVNFMKENKNNVLLISPEGTLKKSEWKSGFYYIAKELNIPIIVGGIDFATHTFKCNTNVEFKDYNLPYDEAINKIKKMFSESLIYPRHLHKSNPEIFHSHKVKVSYLPISRYIFFLSLLFFKKIRFYIVLISSIILFFVFILKVSVLIRK